MNAMQKAEQMIALGDRLSDAMASDIEALESGRAGPLRVADPDVQQLSLHYGREARGLDAKAAKSLPPELRARLVKSTARFHDTLGRHQRLLARVRNASEGMIRAIAEEVEKRRANQRTYTRAPYRASAGAMIYSSIA